MRRSFFGGDGSDRMEVVVKAIATATLVLAASFSSGTSAHAQGTDSARGPEVGTRVRVFAPELRTDRYVGRIKSIDASVMVIDTGEVRTVLGMESGPVLVDAFRRVTIRLSTIEHLEVSGGRTVRSALARGMVFGALIGGVIFGLGNMPEVNPDANDFLRGVPVGLIVGSIGGAVVGFGVGGEAWVPARIPR
jgi:hypothetical protein